MSSLNETLVEKEVKNYQKMLNKLKKKYLNKLLKRRIFKKNKNFLNFFS